jgi:hypothetical protein
MVRALLWQRRPFPLPASLVRTVVVDIETAFL